MGTPWDRLAPICRCVCVSVPLSLVPLLRPPIVYDSDFVSNLCTHVAAGTVPGTRVHTKKTRNKKTIFVETYGHQTFAHYCYCFWFFENIVDPKQSSSHKAFIKNEFYDGGILLSLGNLKILKHKNLWKSENLKA